MKKMLKNKTILTALFLGVVISLSSCSEWTEMQSLDIKKPIIQEQNPELYAQYLAALNEYKRLDHKIVYVTFDNHIVVAGSRADHINIIPDSVDIISLDKADNLTSIEIQEMAEVRTKGTKFVYTISYEKIQSAYKQEKLAFDEAQKPVPAANGDDKPEVPEVPEFMTFGTYLSDRMNEQIAICNKYGYDGITISYNGRVTYTMSEAEKKEYIENQNIMILKLSAWLSTYKSKMLIFSGVPSNMVDRTLLSSCKYIILRTEDLRTNDELTQKVQFALVGDGIPTNNIIVAANTFSADADDEVTGYFLDGSCASHSMAYWTLMPNGEYTKAGIAIYGIKTDYYNRNLVYKNTRGAIDVLCPSAKN